MELQHSNMALIFFIYGLAFFVMGLAIALELRHSSALRLSRGLRLLALFGLLHGVAQWSILFLLVESEGVTIQGSPALRTLFVVLSAVAALALMQFGITLITSTVSGFRWLRVAPAALLAGWIFSFGAPFLYEASTTASAAGLPSANQCVGCHWSASADYVVASKEWLTSADIWSRYLLYLPGSVLAAVGFFLQRPTFRELGMPQIGRLSLWAAASFAVSALVAGIVVPPAPYLPASVLNYATFSERLWFPPQILWAVSAVAIAYFVIRILSVFEIERQRQLQAAVAAREQAQARTLAAQRRARDASERWSQQLEEQVQQRSRELEAFYRLTVDMSNLLDLDEILQSVAERARSLLRADLAVLGLWEPGANTLGIRAVSGNRSEAFTSLRLPTNDETAAALRQLREARALLVDEKEGPNGALRQAMKRESLRHLALVPLRMGERPQGLLCVGLRGRRRFHQPELEMLSRLGAQASIAIENARLYEQAQQLAVLEERERIARELHDSLAQALGYIGLRAGLAMDHLESDDLAGLRSEIERVEETAEEAYTDVRASILDLRSGSPERGLIPTLTEYLKKFSLETGIKAEIHVPEGVLPRLAPAAEIQLIRVVQEALTNVRKHAVAARAVVRFECAEDESTIVSVEDDGRGFDLAGAEKRAGAHFGLQTMRERTESVGGSLEIETAPGRGTRVIAVFPSAARGGRRHAAANKSALGG
jgi:nitrate/nitrite-specific signal transduction histidine kinase